jgi:predicted site-specific integrase-resolvase
MRRLIRITESSKYLGVSATALRRWVRDGLCPVMKSPGGRWFWSVALLDEIKMNMLEGNYAHTEPASVADTVCKQ